MFSITMHIIYNILFKTNFELPPVISIYKVHFILINLMLHFDLQ